MYRVWPADREADQQPLDDGGCVDVSDVTSSFVPPNAVQWTVILPFLNEAQFLPHVLACIAHQRRALRLVLVDNGSDDASHQVARQACQQLCLEAMLLSEPRRGKVHALAAGLRHVTTDYVATFDADTAYDCRYLDRATALLSDPEVAAAQAYYTYPEWPRWRRAIAAAKLHTAAAILPHQCHNGGAGQVFRTAALMDCGGFDPAIWDQILEDHEIIHRVASYGRFISGRGFTCSPARRKNDAPSLRWSLFERLAYHLTPRQLQARFFYDFLGPRLTPRRGNPAPSECQLALAERPRWAA